MKQSKIELIQSNLGIVYWQLVRYLWRWPDEPSELASIFLEALCRAADKFDEKLGYKFSSYAVTAMKNAYIDAIRSIYKRKEVRILDLVKHKDISEEEAFDLLKYTIPVDAEASNIQYKYTRLKLNTMLQCKILKTLIEDPNKSAEDIGKQLGCSGRYVRKVIKVAAKNFIRKEGRQNVTN